MPLSEAGRSAVESVVERVRAAVAETPAGRERRRVRWVRTDGLHVTLRFLGPTLPDRLEGVERAVVDTSAGAVPFRARIHGAGGFPRPDRPRTLWLRIVEGEAELATLAARLDERLAEAGWPRETRPFRAHLTLARTDGVPSGPDALRLLIAEAADLSLEWLVDELVLFESVTGGGPARYEPLLRTGLAGAASEVGASGLHGLEGSA